jgi:CubicO group peptidase (beta-lactamase class C family)
MEILMQQSKERRVRLVSRFVMSAMFAAVLLQSPVPAAVQSVASTPAPPPLAERLDRLAAEIERHRIDLHVPGVAVAVVRGDEVIFSKGFGLADVSKKAPVTPDTRFFIGSTTKAFTATLVGMLVDEGRMQWDDPVEKYVPAFKLAVQSKNPGDRATLRDVLSHRTGFTRMSLLDTNTGMSSEEILRQASSAEALAPFRQRFLYNNQHYVAAGLAAGAAAGSSWSALVKARILTPLGMTSTRTTEDAWNEPGTARGYSWDEVRKKLEPLALETQGINIDGLAPAGAISSTVIDMASWIRFLLRQGVHDGKALISPASLAATLTPQVQVGGGGAYGMGWMVRPWRGQRLIVHDGALMGFSAVVGMLPESDLGFVVLANTQSALPAIALQLVPQYLLGELPPRAGDSGDLKPYVGRYVANFAAFSNEIFTISRRNGRLVIDIPSQLESALSPPRADGRWPLVMTDQLAVSFDRDKRGRVVGLRLHEGGQEFEVPREGVVVAPEIPLAELQKYVGRYAGGPLELTVFIQNQRLAVRLPNNASLDLRPPEPGGRRAARANAAIALAFEESPAGAVTAVNFYRPNLPVMRLTPASPLPTVAEIMKLRRIPASSTSATIRTIGRVRFAQSGVEGRFMSASAGDDRSRLEIDLGRFGQTQVVLNNGRGWRAATGDSIRELSQKQLKQVRLADVIFGDWRKSYDVRVIRAGQFEGRKVYGVQLESAGLPPAFVAVDAETGDALQVLRRVIVGSAGAMETTTTYSDYRDVGGMRVPHRYVETAEQTGRIIYDVERVEVGVELSPDTFRPKLPAAGSARARAR